MKKNLMITLILSILMPGIAMAMKKTDTTETGKWKTSFRKKILDCEEQDGISTQETKDYRKYELLKDFRRIASVALVTVAGLAIVWHLWKNNRKKKAKNKKEISPTH